MIVLLVYFFILLSTPPNHFSSLSRAFTDSSPLILQSVLNEIKVPASNQPTMPAFMTCSLLFQSHIFAPLSQAILTLAGNPPSARTQQCHYPPCSPYFFPWCPVIIITVYGGCVPWWLSWSHSFPVSFPLSADSHHLLILDGDSFGARVVSVHCVMVIHN